MQNIVILKLCRFIPACRNNFWSRLMVRVLVRPYPRCYDGLKRFACIEDDRLRESLEAGHGILIISNHFRQCDPMPCGNLTEVVGHPVWCTAWPVDTHSRTAWIDRVLPRRCGAFSIYRGGSDHASLQLAGQSLVAPNRPVVILQRGQSDAPMIACDRCSTDRP